MYDIFFSKYSTFKRIFGHYHTIIIIMHVYQNQIYYIFVVIKVTKTVDGKSSLKDPFYEYKTKMQEIF